MRLASGGAAAATRLTHRCHDLFYDRFSAGFVGVFLTQLFGFFGNVVQMFCGNLNRRALWHLQGGFGRFTLDAREKGVIVAAT